MDMGGSCFVSFFNGFVSEINGLFRQYDVQDSPTRKYLLALAVGYEEKDSVDAIVHKVLNYYQEVLSYLFCDLQALGFKGYTCTTPWSSVVVVFLSDNALGLKFSIFQM
jgi:hypothetical protein